MTGVGQETLTRYFYRVTKIESKRKWKIFIERTFRVTNIQKYLPHLDTSWCYFWIFGVTLIVNIFTDSELIFGGLHSFLMIYLYLYTINGSFFIEMEYFFLHLLYLGK